MKSKKKFKDTTVGKILIGASSLIPGVGPALADVLQGSQTPLEALNAIRDSGASPEDKHRLTELLLKADAEEQRNVTRRWESDNMYGNILSKTVRPLLALTLGIGMLVGWYLDYDLSQIMPLGTLTLGGYFGVRSVEKIMGNKMHK